MKRPAWLKKRRIVTGFVIVGAIVGAIFLLYRFSWTGFGESHDKNILTITETATEKTQQGSKTTTKTTTTDKLEPAKTLWDWMSLFLAPATLAGLGFWFQHSQEKAKDAKETADTLAAADQQREAALQDYLSILSELLVDKRLKQLLPQTPESQHEKSEDDATSSTTDVTDTTMRDSATKVGISKAEPAIDADAALYVVKARTLSLLRLFDKDIPRKASVLSFLGDADILTKLGLDLSWFNL